MFRVWFQSSVQETVEYWGGGAPFTPLYVIQQISWQGDGLFPEAFTLKCPPAFVPGLPI